MMPYLRVSLSTIVFLGLLHALFLPALMAQEWRAAAAERYVLPSGKPTATDFKSWILAASEPVTKGAQSATTLAGKIPGSFAVDSEGNATYNMPISVPPGVRGISPSLSLQYKSNGGNGFVGLGWHLAGLGKIVRVGADADHDSFKGSVSYSASDRFSLNGARLMATVPAGGYGALGVEGKEYRTDPESFTKIISHGSSGAGPLWFECFGKNGLIHQYGGNASSTEGRAFATGQSHVREWLLSSVMDRDGNRMLIDYATNGEGQYYPENIRYVRRDDGGYSAGVTVLVEDRPDDLLSYVGGFPVRETKRLAAIRPFSAPTVAELKGIQYNLNYEDSEFSASVSWVPRSRLTDVRMHSWTPNEEVYLRTTTFDWETGIVAPIPEPFTSENALVLAWPTYDSEENDYNDIISTRRNRIKSGDFNADGRTDLLVINSHGNALENTIYFGTGNPGNLYSGPVGTGVYTPVSDEADDAVAELSTVLVADFNGDGRDDLYVVNGDGGYAVDELYYSNGDGTFQSPVPGINSHLSSSPNGKLADLSRLILTDVNGDSKTDIYYVNSYGGQLQVDVPDTVHLATTTGFAAPVTGPSTYDPALTFGLMWVFANQLYSTYSFYINSFGLSRVFTPRRSDVSPGGVHYRFMKGFSRGSVSPGHIKVGDFNADGMSDIYVLRDGADELFLSQGDGTFSGSQPGLSSDLSTSTNYRFRDYLRTQLGDFNGDGSTDILYWDLADDEYVPSLYLCNGNGGFELAPNMTLPCVENPNSISLATLNLQSIVLADMNSDGFLDVLLRRRLYESAEPDVICDIPGEVASFWETPVLLGDGTGNFDGDYVGATMGFIDFLDQPFGIFDFQIGHVYSSKFYEDLDGNGIGDVLWLRDIGVPDQQVQVYRNNLVRPVIRSITDGVGYRVEVDYSMLQDDSIYGAATASSFPPPALVPGRTMGGRPRGMRVVKQVRTPDGLGAQRALDYTYGSYREDVYKGSLGFHSVRTWDADTRLESITTFQQSFSGWTGILGVEEWKIRADGTEVQTERRTLSPVSFVDPVIGNRIQRVEGLSILRRSVDSGAVIGEWTESSTFDEYSNVKSTTLNQPDGLTYHQWFNYSNDESSWLLGLVTNSHTKIQQRDVYYDYTYEPYNPSKLNSVTVSWEEVGLSNVAESKFLKSAFGYDLRGNTTLQYSTGSDMEPRASWSTYSDDGRFLVENLNHLLHTEHFTYDPLWGNLLSSTDPNGVESNFDYDQLGRLTGVRPSDGDDVTYLIEAVQPGDPAGTRLRYSSVKASGVSSVSFLNVLGQTIETRGSAFPGLPDIVTKNVYDQRGNILSEGALHFAGDSSSDAQYSYDEFGRLGAFTDATGYSTQVSRLGFDPVLNDSRMVFTGSGGERREYGTRHDQIVWHARGTVAEPELSYQHCYYDQLNLHYANVMQGTEISVVIRDELGRPTHLLDPSIGLTERTVGADSRVLEGSINEGLVFSNSFDVLGRPVVVETPEYQASFVHDTAPFGIGKVHTITIAPTSPLDQPYVLENTFDQHGKLSASSQVVGTDELKVEVVRGDFGRVQQVIYPTGFRLENVYDAKGNLVAVRDADASLEFWRWTDIAADGRIKESEHGNGIRTTFAWGANSRELNAATAYLPGTTDYVLFEWLFRDDLLRLTDEIDLRSGLASSRQYEYDALDRLAQTHVYGDTPVQLTYSPTGNILSKSDIGNYAYESANAGPLITHPHAFTSAGTSTASYDPDGRCLSLDGHRFTYTSAGAMRTWTNNADAVYIQRDHFGRPVRQVVSGQLDEDWLFFGSRYARRVRQCSTDHFHYIFAGQDLPVCVRVKTAFELTGSCPITKPTKTYVYYLHRDVRGSLKTVTGSQGQVLASYQYDAWGVQTVAFIDPAHEDIIAGFRDGYTGHGTIRGTDDLVETPTRIYHPATGRFLAPDHTVPDFYNPADHNRYSYVRNNPVNLVDPSGKTPIQGTDPIASLDPIVVSATSLKPALEPKLYLIPSTTIEYTVGDLMLGNPAMPTPSTSFVNTHTVGPARDHFFRPLSSLSRFFRERTPLKHVDVVGQVAPQAEVADKVLKILSQVGDGDFADAFQTALSMVDPQDLIKKRTKTFENAKSVVDNTKVGLTPKKVLKRDVVDGPHAPNRKIEKVIDRAVGGDGKSQGRWNSKEAAQKAANKNKGSKKSVDIDPGDGTVVSPLAGRKGVWIRDADKAITIPKKSGEIHTFPIPPEHSDY